MGHDQVPTRVEKTHFHIHAKGLADANICYSNRTEKTLIIWYIIYQQLIFQCFFGNSDFYTHFLSLLTPFAWPQTAQGLL